jgi:isoleucyl-tRNA synthetase
LQQLLAGLEANVMQLLITSGFTVADLADAPADAQDIDGVKLVVARAEGEVCDRCRMTTTDVGSDSRYPHFCARCAAIVATNFPETAAADFAFEG